MTANDYTSKDIKRPDPMDHVRKRVGMYLGSNDSLGITTGLRELIDNGVDEVLIGHGKEIIVKFYPDNSTEVQDYGRGLPVDKNPEGINGIILTIGTIGSGGKFTGKAISGGLNGVGASATNATSSRFDVKVWRGGKQYELSFKEGKPGFFAKPDDPHSKFTPNTELKVSKDPRSAAEQKKNPTGTNLKFWPDYTVFLPDSKVDVDDIKRRLKATCFLLPQLTATVEDYRNNPKGEKETYHFNAGLVDMIPTLTPRNLIIKPIHLKAEAAFTENTNVLQDDGKMKQQEVERPVSMEVVFGYTNHEETTLSSFVNIIGTAQHGTHVDGMWRALSREIIRYIKEGKTAKFLKAKEEPPTMEDVRDGFVGVVSVMFPEPTFMGQAKTTLATQQITTLVSQNIGDALKNWLGERKNTAQAKLLAQKVVEAKRIREAAKAQKDTARKKSQLETSASMPAKLVDCEFPQHEYSELHIVEGDSAAGTIKAARDSRYQAFIPIRGKILNTHKATTSQLLANAECAALIQVVGAGSGKTFNLDQMRYHNIFLEVDADVDGSHIRSLLLTFFMNTMPELVKEGRLYASEPPLYILKTTGKNPKVHYLQSDAARDKLLAKLEKEGIKHEPLQRLKGLGEMDAGEFWDTTLNPETRTVRQITIDDMEEATRMLDLAMGNDVEPRKEWIMTSRDLLSDTDLSF